MSKIIKFGEDVEGYEIPVLNEREIRAAAGLLFLMMLISIMVVIFKGDFTMLKYAVVLFLTDILIRVFINPKFAPTLIIGRLIVRNQTPEYVGARQKKFAWYIGIALALTMFFLLVVVNTYNPITGPICFICLIFLFFESAFGICLGCKIYPIFFKNKVQYCPGEICEIKDRQNIQKTSWGQILIALTFIVFAVAMVYFMGDIFSTPPADLWKMNNH